MLLLSICSTGLAQNSVKDYLQRYQSLAISCMKRHGIPASVILAVAIVESGAGTSKICTYNHNHFGIAGTSKGVLSRLPYRTRFRSYATDAESYQDFCNLVQEKDFYPRLKNSTAYQQWIAYLTRTYARDSGKWQQKVLGTIRQYRLYELDKQ